MESQQSGPANGQREKSSDGGHTLGERVDRMSDSAHQVWSRTRDAFGDIKGTVDLDGRVKRHPYGTLAAAIGIGYVLGGGLFSRLTARLLGTGLRIGIRLAALPMIKDELLGLAGTLGGEEGGEEGGARSRGKKESHSNKGRQP
jgi:hypothetical protein